MCKLFGTVAVVYSCPYCEEVERVRRHGRTLQGTERLYCNVCRRARAPSPKSRSLTAEKEQMILNALSEKTALIGICRTFKVSSNTVYALLTKNGEAQSPLGETVLPCACDEAVVDELWTFVRAKPTLEWVWLVLSRRHLQVAHQLWQQVPSHWRDGLVFTNGWKVYQSLFQDTPGKHCRCNKGHKSTFGETSVVEGANNALRQCVSYGTQNVRICSLRALA